MPIPLRNLIKILKRKYFDFQNDYPGEDFNFDIRIKRKYSNKRIQELNERIRDAKEATNLIDDTIEKVREELIIDQGKNLSQVREGVEDFIKGAFELDVVESHLLVVKNIEKENGKIKELIETSYPTLESYYKKVYEIDNKINKMEETLKINNINVNEGLSIKCSEYKNWDQPIISSKELKNFDEAIIIDNGYLEYNQLSKVLCMLSHLVLNNHINDAKILSQKVLQNNISAYFKHILTLVLGCKIGL